MARLTIEDYDGVIDAIAFPKIYGMKRNIISNDMIVGLSGRVSFKDENDAEILIEDIVPIEDIASLSRRGRENSRIYYNGRSPAGGQSRDSSGRGYNNGYNGGYGGAGNAERRDRNISSGQAALDVNNLVKLRVTEDVVRSHRDEKAVLYHLTDMMSLYPGNRDVLVYLPGGRTIRVNPQNRIELEDGLRTKLLRMLGEGNVKG
jgi:DNA polymerase-3 subunit alpha